MPRLDSTVPASKESYRFGRFCLRAPDRILERDGERIPLTPKVIDTLLVLLENCGQVVTKEDLMKSVWPDVTVVESGLTRNISVLRRALEEDCEGSFIETIPRRGYRFTAEVTREESALPPTIQPAAEEAPVCTAFFKTHAPPANRRPRWIWGLAVAVLLAGFTAIWAVQHRGQSSPSPAVEPFVRIGEHLLYKLAPAETVRALQHFERAIGANPRSAGAHAGLSIALLQLSSFGVWLPKAPPLTAAEAARKAVQLDPRSGTAHFAQAMVHTFQNWDFAKAETEFRTALALDPESVQTRLGYGRLKLATGALPEARRLVEEALRLDPASPALGVEYCRVFYFQRDFRQAESECRKVLDREPGYALAHYYLGLSLGLQGRSDEARAGLEASRLRPGVVEADHAWLRVREGDPKPAIAALAHRRDLMRQGKVDASAKLLLAAILDRNDEAFEALEAGIAHHSPDLLTLHFEPRLDSLRLDPRYSAIVRRMQATRYP